MKTWKDRQIFLDVLRVMATMAVVMMHAISGVLNGFFDLRGWERRVKAFHALIDVTSWSVPVFLIISGYLFLNPKRRVTVKDAAFKYCRRILFTLIIFGIPYALLELVGYLKYFEWWMVPRAIKNTAMGRSWSHMWYLYLILILYALTPLIKWLLEKVPKAVVYGIMAILALGVSIVPFFEVLKGADKIYAIPKQGIYVFYYLCGYAFAIRKKKPTKKEGIYCMIGFSAILILETVSRFVEGYDLEMAYGYPLTLFAAILLFDAGWTFQKLAEDVSEEAEGSAAMLSEEKKEPRKIQGSVGGKILKVTTWMSPLCFGIYLIHPAFLNLFYKILKISINNFRFYVGVPLFFGIAFFGALISTWILRLIPPMRKYVL